MPPHGFPRELAPTALDFAEKWCNEGRFRSIVEEWIPRQRAALELYCLLYDGFRLRGQTDKREEPIPVLIRLMHTMPYPANAVELRERMLELFARAIQEWCRGRDRFGDDLERAPW